MSCCQPQDAAPRSCRRMFMLLALAAVLLTALGMAALLRDGLRDIQGQKRTVSVRGLAEREVEADLAAWPFSLSVTANDLLAAQEAMENQEKILRAFLGEQGLDAGALTLLRYDVQDLLAQQYRPEGVERGRFVLSKMLMLRTNDVAKVESASQAIDALVRRGVALGQGSQPSYLFTRLNEVKPDMIREATANARDAADQFAKDSGAHVGGIAMASQGVFSIDGRDDISTLGNYTSFTPDMQLHKKVRVVTSVTYRLD